MKSLLVALALAFMTGCAGQIATDTLPAPVSVPAPAPKAAVNLAGFSPAFKQGYADGCASAKSNAARARDETRYKSEADYAQGWRDGYDICGRRK